MSVKINGIGKLRANYYKKLVVKEDSIYGKFNVDVLGDKIEYATETIGDRFSSDFKEMSDYDQIRLIIDDYIKNAKICGITDLVALPSYNNKKFIIVYGNYGYKEMLLQLFSKEFSDVFKNIREKYYQDRFDFCYDEKGIKTFKIDTCRYGSLYTLDLDKIHRCASQEEYFKHIKLCEENFMIKDNERKFIEDFIINRFSKFGTEIEVKKVYNTEYEFTRRDVLGYMLVCGDVKIYVPNYHPLLFILTIVGNYNLKLRYEKENCMKRQLRMEEF